MKAVIEREMQREGQKEDFSEASSNFSLLAHETPSNAYLGEHSTSKKSFTQKNTGKSKKEFHGTPKEADFDSETKSHSPACQRLNFELLSSISSYHNLVLRYHEVMSLLNAKEFGKGQNSTNHVNLASKMDSLLQLVLKDLERLDGLDIKGVITLESRIESQKDDISLNSSFQASNASSLLLHIQFEWLLLQLNLLHLQFACHLTFMLGTAKTSNPASLRHHFVHATNCLIIACSKAVGMSELTQREAMIRKSIKPSISGLSRTSSENGMIQRALHDVMNLMKLTSSNEDTGVKGEKAKLKSGRETLHSDDMKSNDKMDLVFERSKRMSKTMVEALPTQILKILDSIRFLALSYDSGTLSPSSNGRTNDFPSYHQIRRLMRIEYGLCEDFIFFFSSLPHLPLLAISHPFHSSHMSIDDPFHKSQSIQIIPEFEKGQKISFAFSSLTSFQHAISSHLNSFRSSINAEKMGCLSQSRHLLEISIIHLSKLYTTSPHNTSPIDRSLISSITAKRCAAIQYAQELAKSPSQYEKALQVLYQLIDHKFQLPMVWNYIGVIEKWRGNLAKSLGSFKQSISVDSSFLPAPYNLSRLYHHQKNYDTEMRMLELLLPHLEAREEDEDENPISPSMITSPLNSTLVSWKLIFCYSNKGYFERALQEIEKIEKKLFSQFNDHESQDRLQKYLPMEHAIIDGYPFLTKSSVRNEKARIFLSMQDPAHVLHLYGISSGQNNPKSNGDLSIEVVAKERGCEEGKSENWEKGHPDPSAILLAAEALLCSGKSSEALYWLTFLSELFDETRKFHEQSEIEVSGPYHGNHRQFSHLNGKTNNSSSHLSFIFRGHLINECFCGANSVLFTKTSFGVDRYLLMHFDTVNNMAATYQCRQEYEMAMDMFAKARKLAENISSQNKAYIKRQNLIIDEMALNDNMKDNHRLNGGNGSHVMTEKDNLNDIDSQWHGLHSSTVNRLTISNYNFCLLAFKLGKKEKASIDWIKFRFKIEDFSSLPSADKLLSLKSHAEDMINQINKDSMVHDTIVMNQGQIPLWQLLQFDIHILSLAIHIHFNMMRV